MSRGEHIVYLSNISTVKVCAHAHDFVCSATKSGPDSRSSASAQRLKCKLPCTAAPLSFFLPNYPIQKLLQLTVPLRKKLLLPQKTHNPKNNNANPHAHNLKK
jgi:hypothetical protein